MPCSPQCHVCPSSAGMCPGTGPVYFGRHPTAIQWPDMCHNPITAALTPPNCGYGRSGMTSAGLGTPGCPPRCAPYAGSRPSPGARLQRAQTAALSGAVKCGSVCAAPRGCQRPGAPGTAARAGISNTTVMPNLSK